MVRQHEKLAGWFQLFDFRLSLEETQAFCQASHQPLKQVDGSQNITDFVFASSQSRPPIITVERSATRWGSSPEKVKNDKLKKSAKRNRRSINNEIIVCIEKSVQSQAIDTNRILAQARMFRSLTEAVPITDHELIEAIEDGRP